MLDSLIVIFVKDAAALTILFPQEMNRRIERTSTVLTSLVYATRDAGVGYLMNGSRYIARNPTCTTTYGTTRKETFHEELKGFFRNVMAQLGRRAVLLGEIATTVKLLSG